MAHVRTDDEKQAFLDALAKCGVASAAAATVSIHPATVKNWRKQDEQFAAAYDEAIEFSSDTLEIEARRRAVEGVTRLKALGSGDNMSIVEEITYSDTLLIALLKANKPDKFADRTKAEISNPDGSMRPESTTEAAVRINALLEEAKRKRDAGQDPLFS